MSSEPVPSMDDVLSTADLASPRPVPGAGLWAATLGNGLEFYDFTIFAFFAVPIGHVFFPARNPLTSLLLSVATFGVGFVTRPLGAAVIGSYADRRGRRASLVLTVALMASSMAVLALTPGYATIGLAAPALVVAARLLQSFALGGDVGPASAFLIETAPAGRRGWRGGWQIASQGGSALLAGLVGLALAAILPSAALENWGFRVAMLLGLAIVPVGFVLRRSLPETLPSAAERAATSPLARAFSREGRRVVGAGVLICMAATVATYTANYLTTYAQTVLHLPPGVSLGVTATVGAATLLGALAGGALSDRTGRRPVIAAFRLASVLVVFPAFLAMNRFPGAVTLNACAALLALANAPSAAAGVVFIAESFPRAQRSVGLATTYAIGISVFGGTTQFIITGLIALNGDPLCPAWYLIGTGLIGFAATFLLPETVSPRHARPMPDLG